MTSCRGPLGILGLLLGGVESSLRVDSWEADFLGLKPSCLGEQAGEVVLPEDAEPLPLSVNQEKGRNGETPDLPDPSTDSLLPMDRRLLPFSFRLLPVDARRRVTPRSRNFRRVFLSRPMVGLAGSGGLVSWLSSSLCGSARGWRRTKLGELSEEGAERGGEQEAAARPSCEVALCRGR